MIKSVFILNRLKICWEKFKRSSEWAPLRAIPVVFFQWDNSEFFIVQKFIETGNATKTGKCFIPFAITDLLK